MWTKTFYPMSLPRALHVSLVPVVTY